LESRRRDLPFKSYFNLRFGCQSSLISVVRHRRSMSINIGKRKTLFSVSSQNRPWSNMWGQPLESRFKQLPFKSYFKLRFGRHGQVGRGRKCWGSRLKCVCMLLKTEVTSTSRKSPIFPWRVPLVSQVRPGTGRSNLHGETSQHPKYLIMIYEAHKNDNNNNNRMPQRRTS